MNNNPYQTNPMAETPGEPGTPQYPQNPASPPAPAVAGAPQKPKNRKRNLLIGAGASAALLAACCLVVVVILVFDPFKLGLLGRLTGTYDASATVMPTDTKMYMGINLLNTTPARLTPIIDAFTKNATKTQVKDTQDALNKIDKQLDDALGVTLTDDIIPWLGQYAGLGLTDVSYDSYGSPKDAGVVLAIEARATGAADEFLAKLQKGIERKQHSKFSQKKYKGVTIYTLTSQTPNLAFARSGRMVLFSLDDRTIKDAIDAQNGKSLYTQSAYKDIIKQLPRQRSFTMFANSKQLRNILEPMLKNSAAGSFQNLDTSLAMWTDIGISLSIVDAGVQMDVASAYDMKKLGKKEQELLKGSGASKVAEVLPENTLAFLTGQRLDLTWEIYRDALNTSLGGDFNTSLNMLEKEVGVNPDTDLFPYLDGDWAVGVLPTNQASHMFAGLKFAPVILSHTSDSNALLNTLDSFSSYAQKNNTVVDSSQTGELTLYELKSGSAGDTYLAGGVGKEWITFSTDPGIVKDFFSNSTSLSRSPQYLQVMKSFPGGSNPGLYINMTDLVGSIRETLTGTSLDSFDQTAQYIEPITSITIAQSPLSGNIKRSTLIVFINTK